MNPSPLTALFRTSVGCLLFLAGCGPGFNIDRAGVDDATNPITSFRISFGVTSIRKNDCEEATLQVFDAGGANVTNVTATVGISATDATNVHLYATLLGCQTYDATDEITQLTLTPAAPSGTFYVRTDDDALSNVEIRASSADSDVSAGSKVLPTEFNRFYFGRGPNYYVWRLIDDPLSDKVYVIGEFDIWDDEPRSAIARLNADGTLDNTFTPLGAPSGEAIWAAYPLADGKVLVGGDFTSMNGVACTSLARLNSDGSLDNTFALTGSGLNGGVLGIAVQTDDQILAVGGFGTYNGVSQAGIIRLNTDGSRDMTFAQSGSGFNNGIGSLALQGDGRILVGGFFTGYNGTSRRYVARLNTNGTLDGSFAQTGTGLSSDVYFMTRAASGGVFVSGSFVNYNGTARRYIAKLTSSGGLDTTFATVGTGFDSAPTFILEQTDGSVLVGGSINSYNGTSRRGVVRLTSTGALDNTFSFSGSGISGTTRGLMFDSLGRLLVGGQFTGYQGTSRRFVLALESDGSLVDGYGPVSETLDSLPSVTAVQSDGKVLLGGYFDKWGDTARGGILRLNTDGELDSTFVPAGNFTDYTSVLALSLYTDARILVGGSFTDFNSLAVPYLLRFNSDGSVDGTFSQTGTGFDGAVRAAIVLSDDTALVAGEFTAYNGTSRRRVARVNSDGSLDSSFTQTGTGLNNTVNAMVLQPDGKIIVGGDFTSYNGSARRRVARLNANGTVDTSFVHSGTGLNGSVSTLALQDDGTIVVGGSFTSYNGTSRPYLARLLSNGQLDTTFGVTGTGLNSNVSSVSIAPDGKILVGGPFTSYNGTTLPYLARFLTDGTLDTTFPLPESVPSDAVSQLLLTPDRKLLMLGSFLAFGTSTNQPYFARTTYSGKLD